MIHGVVSVIIPTGGRNTLEAALYSLRRTTREYPVQVILEIDGSYDTYYDLCDHNYSSDYYSVFVYSSYGKGAIIAWNNGLVAADGEYIVMGADDLVFQEHWLSEALWTLRENTRGHGCVGFNDQHNGAAHQTHFLMHRSFIVNYLGGVLVCPKYHHFYVDREIIDRARRVGLYAYAEQSVVRHDHPANGRRSWDKWDFSIKDFMQQDERLFVERQAQGFPDNYSPVITA